jgi:hypothetical protein
MNCIQHPDRNAVETCAACGGGVCEFCRTIVEGKTYCPPCVETVVAGAGAADGASPQAPADVPPQVPADTPMQDSVAGTPFELDQALPPVMNQVPPAAVNQPSPLAVDRPVPSAVSRTETPSWSVEYGEEGTRFEALWMFAIFACGALAVYGVFLPWMTGSAWIFTISISGWDATQLAGIAGSSLIEPYIVIGGGVLMMLFALPAAVIAATSTEVVDTVRTLARLSVMASTMVLVIIIWTIIDIGGVEEASIGYGVWLVLAMSIIGIVISGFMSR